MKFRNIRLDASSQISEASKPGPRRFLLDSEFFKRILVYNLLEASYASSINITTGKNYNHTGIQFLRSKVFRNQIF